MTLATVNTHREPLTKGLAVIPFNPRVHLWRRMDHQTELRAKLNAGTDVTVYEAA